MAKLKILRFVVVVTLMLIGIFIFLLLPEMLTYNVVFFDNIPAGTIIGWLLFICYSFLMVWMFPKKVTPAYYLLRKAIYVPVLMSFCWGFFSRLLAGNWAFSFFNKQLAFKIWLGISGGIVLLPLLCFLILVIIKLRRFFIKTIP